MTQSQYLTGSPSVVHTFNFSLRHCRYCRKWVSLSGERYPVNANSHITILHSDRSSQPAPCLNPTYPTFTCAITTAWLRSTRCELQSSTNPCRHKNRHSPDDRPLTFDERCGVYEKLGAPPAQYITARQGKTGGGEGTFQLTLQVPAGRGQYKELEVSPLFTETLPTL